MQEWLLPVGVIVVFILIFKGEALAPKTVDKAEKGLSAWKSAWTNRKSKNEGNTIEEKSE